MEVVGVRERSHAVAEALVIIRICNIGDMADAAAKAVTALWLTPAREN
jgi:hypothetical protein